MWQRRIVVLFSLAMLGWAGIVVCQNPESDALYPVERDGKWGYINRTGQVVVEFQFDYAWEFSEGIGRISSKAKKGFIDKFGRIIVKPEFDNAQDFSEGFAAVQKAKNWGYVDKTGRMVIEMEYFNYEHQNEEWAVEELPSFSDGIVVVLSSNGTDFIDTRAKVVTHLKDQIFTRFSEGLGRIEIDGKFGWMDKKGQITIVPKFDYAENFSEGLAAVRFGNLSWEGKAGDKWGYIDKTGKIVIEPKYDSASSFSEGLASVKKDEKAGWIDRTGKEVIKLEFDDTYGFSEGLGSFALGGRYGFVDRAGKVVIEPKFLGGAKKFVHGLAAVSEEKQSGYIEKSGRYIWKDSEGRR
jgi:hypothetical protein